MFSKVWSTVWALPFRLASRTLPVCAAVMERYLSEGWEDVALARTLPRGGTVRVEVQGQMTRKVVALGPEGERMMQEMN